MTPDLNSAPSDPNTQTPIDFTASERSAAIRAAFDEDSDTDPPARPAAGERGQPAAAQPPAPGQGSGGAAASQEQPVEDPFAELAEPVRKLIARIPDLEHQVRSANGRYGAMQRELDTLRRAGSPPPADRAYAQSPPAPARPRIDSLETVRGELPEVAQAIEEAVEARFVASQQATADKTAEAAPVARGDDDIEVAALAEAHADWAQTVVSPDFKLWLTQQGEGYSDKVLSTDRSAILGQALTKFKSYAAQVAAQRQVGQQVNQRRSNRVAAAVQPYASGGGSPPRSHPTTYSDLVRQGFDDA